MHEYSAMSHDHHNKVYDMIPHDSLLPGDNGIHSWLLATSSQRQ